MSNNPYRNEEVRPARRSKTSVWVAVGAIFLIILLIIWLTFADLTGDTDVAAFLTLPFFSSSLI